VELIPGIVCDGYILDDNTSVLSERGTADLLGMDQKLLNRMRTNLSQKLLQPLWNQTLSMRTNECIQNLKTLLEANLKMADEVIAQSSRLVALRSNTSDDHCKKT